ncbi:hypothetical protein I3760_02G045900 [Carya illinoinensis]|nr:hypothetical protein I3760_02G045900 [Carya illinoinensis]
MLSCQKVIPHQLQYPFHPKHPLTLSQMKSIEEYQSGDNCRRDHYRWFTYTYTCSRCKFHLCIKCASLSLTTKAKIHDHSLTLVKNLISFTCDACGKVGRGMFYFCIICSFVIHLDCASLLLIVKDHPLNLIYSLPAINPLSCNVCQLCANMVDIDYGVYYCSSCDFVAHLHCATSKEERDETFVQSIKINNLLSHQQFKPGVDENKIAAEIKHFSHEHDIKLIDKFGIKEKCDACMQTIYASGSFGCDACGHFCNGFTYNCEECTFDLDVQYSLIPYNFTYDSHKHGLILYRSQEGKKCNNCD